MASVHPTKTGYEVRYREGTRQRSKSFPSSQYGKRARKLAEQYARQAEQRMSEGRQVLRYKDSPTLEEFAAPWLASHDVSEQTRYNYARYLSVHILPDLGHLKLLELRPARLAEWQARRIAQGAKPAVAGQTTRLLKQILSRAVELEYLDHNPALVLKSPRYDPKPHRWATPEQIEAIRGWFLEHDDPGSATFVSILGYVGIRPQDALALTWQHVLEHRLRVVQKNVDGQILPGSKTGSRYLRSVDVPGPVWQDIAEWRICAGSPAGLIFPRFDGKPWRKYDWDNWRSKRFSKAAPEGFTPYGLRHSAATLMIRAGWTIHEVAHQLGHSVGESLKTYQHVLDAERGAERVGLDELIRRARQEPDQQRAAK